MNIQPRWALIVLLGLFCSGTAQAQVFLPRPFALQHTNKEIRGQVLDFTNNHGKDRRIWSPALGEKRDLYVYVPPCFDPGRRYPLGVFLHGAGQDEQFFLQVVKLFDKSIVEGKLPPVIVVAPDGAIKERASYLHLATFFANTRAGRYEDFVMCDVWDFVMNNFPIRPEREAHCLFGVSMGGAASYALAIKHRDRIKMAVGFAPALNLRWVDCHGKYWSHFDPNCSGWRDRLRPFQVFGKPKPPIHVTFGMVFTPMVGVGKDAMAQVSKFNPAELLDAYNLRPGELDLYAAYGGKDEFNIGAQVESFLFLARQRGIEVAVDYDPDGRHDYESGARMFPGAIDWVAPRVAPYAP